MGVGEDRQSENIVIEDEARRLETVCSKIVPNQLDIWQFWLTAWQLAQGTKQTRWERERKALVVSLNSGTKWEREKSRQTN